MTPRTAPKPIISHRRGTGEMVVLKTFLLVPFAALPSAATLSSVSRFVSRSST